MSMTKNHEHHQSFTLGWLLLLLFSLGVDTDHHVNSANATSIVEPEEAAFQGHCGHTSPCEQLCYEIHDGMYECDCIEGYELNRNGYSCQVINATNIGSDFVHSKSDEDVLYQKGASFSAELDNDETPKSMSTKPSKTNVNQKNYDKFNTNFESDSDSEVENYDYNDFNEHQLQNHKINPKINLNEYYISDENLNFNSDAQDIKTASTANSITSQKSFTTTRPTILKATFKQPSKQSNDENLVKYSGGDDSYRYQPDILKYDIVNYNQLKLKHKKNTYQETNNANKNRKENQNRSHNGVELHISKPIVKQHFISEIEISTESERGTHTLKTISQCNLDCSFDGICSLEPTLLRARCLCPFGKSGNGCKEDVRVRIPRFAKRSWLAFPALHGAFKHVQLRLEFRPESFDGILLLSGERDDLTGDFLALLLNKGFVEFWFDCGSGVGSMRSKETILLNEWNSVIIYRHRWDAWLVLNHGTKVQGRSNGLFSRITFREPVFLGGIGNTTGLSKRLPLAEGFSGCIRRFEANEHDYKFTEHPLGDVINGFDIQDCLTDKCVRYSCKHGGKCLHSEQGAVCLCPIGFVGDLCEIRMDLQVPAFNGSSFLRYAPLGDSALIWLEVIVIFKPEQSEGLILYSGPEKSGDFIALYLNNGFVEFAFDLGSGPALVRSEHTLSLGQWHSVQISRTARLAVLKIDQHQEIMTISSNGFWHLSLRQNLFVGGVNHVNRLPLHLKFKSFFVGCIQKIVINGHTLGIVSEALGGSNVGNCPHACVARPCGLMAECVPQMENYECRCSIYNDKCNKAAEVPRELLPNLSIQKSKTSKYAFPYDEEKPRVVNKNFKKHPKKHRKGEREAITATTSIYNTAVSSTNPITGKSTAYTDTSGPKYIKNDAVLNFLQRKQHTKASDNQFYKKHLDLTDEYRQKPNFLYSLNPGLPTYLESGISTSDQNKPTEWKHIDTMGLKKNSSTDGSIFGLDKPLFDILDSAEDYQKKQLAQNMKRIMSNSNVDKESLTSSSSSKDELVTPVKQSAPGAILIHPSTTPQTHTDWSLLKKFDLSAEHQPQIENVKKNFGACFAGSDSYFHYNDVDTMNHLISYQIDLNLRIKTHSHSGIILWTGRQGFASQTDDYLSLGIEDGYLHFRYDLGSGEVDIQFNGTKISDGLWHRIRAIRNSQDGYLEIDGRKTPTLQTPGTLRQLNTNTGLYVGGLPDVSYFTHQKYFNGIVGCMSEIILAGKIRLNFDTNTLGIVHNVETGLL